MKEYEHSLGFYLNMQAHLNKEIATNRTAHKIASADYQCALSTIALLQQFNARAPQHDKQAQTVQKLQQRLDQLNAQYNGLCRELQQVGDIIKNIPDYPASAYDDAYIIAPKKCHKNAPACYITCSVGLSPDKSRIKYPPRGGH